MTDLERALELLSDDRRNVFAIEKLSRYREDAPPRKEMERRAKIGLMRIMTAELLGRTQDFDFKIKQEAPPSDRLVEEYTVGAFVLTQAEAAQLRILIRNAMDNESASMRLENMLNPRSPEDHP